MELYMWCSIHRSHTGAHSLYSIYIGRQTQRCLYIAIRYWYFGISLSYCMRVYRNGFVAITGICYSMSWRINQSFLGFLGGFYLFIYLFFFLGGGGCLFVFCVVFLLWCKQRNCIFFTIFVWSTSPPHLTTDSYWTLSNFHFTLTWDTHFWKLCCIPISETTLKAMSPLLTGTLTTSAYYLS